MTTNLDARLSSYSSPVLSAFRIMFGLLFTLHGSTKLFGWPLGTSVPVGSWPAWWAGLIEVVTSSPADGSETVSDSLPVTIRRAG